MSSRFFNPEPIRPRSDRFLWAAPSQESDAPAQALVAALRAASIEVVTLSLDHRHADAELDERFLAALADAGGADLIGGCSLGARIAARVAERAQARALLCLAYPFHRRGDPQDAHGLASLLPLRLPTLIVQGTRDAHGGRSTLRGYAELPKNIELHWLQDANHHLVPRQKTGLRADALVAQAAELSLDFLRQHLVSRGA